MIYPEEFAAAFTNKKHNLMVSTTQKSFDFDIFF